MVKKQTRVTSKLIAQRLKPPSFKELDSANNLNELERSPQDQTIVTTLIAEDSVK